MDELEVPANVVISEGCIQKRAKHPNAKIKAPPCVLVSDFYGEIGIVNEDNEIVYHDFYKKILRRNQFYFRVTGLEALVVLVIRHILGGGKLELAYSYKRTHRE